MAMLVSSAQASLLTGIAGSVSLNTGEGFKPVTEATSVSPGDRVRTGNGSAEIVYDNGCSVKIGAGQVVLVLTAAPTCSSENGSFPSMATLAVGGLVVVGGIGAAVLFTGSSSKPASP